MDSPITKIFDCCISSLFIVGSLSVVVMELLIPFNTIYLKLFFLYLS